MNLPILQEQGGALSGLLQGATAGLQQAMPTIQELILNRMKQKQAADLFPQLKLNQTGTETGTAASNVGMMPQTIPELGLNQPQQIPQVTDQDIMRAEVSGRHDIAMTLSEMKKQSEKQQLEEKKVFTPSVQKYFERIEDKRSELPQIKSALEAEQAQIMSGEIDPWSSGHMANIARYLGMDILAPTLETPGSKGFKTAQKSFLTTSLQNAFKGATTSKQINLIEQLLAEPGATKEANLASLWLMQSNMMVDEMEIQLTDSLRSQGVSGYNMPALVSKQLEPYRKQLSDQYTEAVRELINRSKK